MDHLSEDDRGTILRQGVRRLRDWLPSARGAARRAEDFQEEYASASLKAVYPYVREANLYALVIYPAPKGGWHGDVLLNDVPLGVASALGSPKEAPLPTREAAEKYLRTMLVHALVIADRIQPRVEDNPPPPGFALFNWETDLNPEALAIVRDLMPSDYTRERAITFLEETLAEVAPGGFDGERVKDWPASATKRLYAALHIASLKGIMRYPLTRDMPPSAEA